MAPSLRERHGAKELQSEAGSIAEVLAELGIDAGNVDLQVLVNGRAMAFLAGTETVLEASDVMSVFFSGIRGFPGG
jgi:molybdopterin converting factor small subunit